MSAFYRLLAFALAAALLSACSARPYRIRNIAKSEIDLVADAHLQEMNRLMETLMVKLYKRNPNQLPPDGTQSIERRVAEIFELPGPLRFAELDRREGEDAINLCFDDRFSGDRVFALMVGLAGMIRKSYNDQREFFILDSLDQQKLYNSARNIEILVWRLASRRKTDGAPYLLTNGLPGEVRNLSYERIFGKMIAVQDMMARILEDRTNRMITKVVTTAASAFMPVGF